jgi:hypothetical protein
MLDATSQPGPDPVAVRAPLAVALESPSCSADARAERAAQQVGLAAAEIERLPFDLSALEDEGVFVVRRATRS